MALISKNRLGKQTISISTVDTEIDDLLKEEWLLSNSRGGFSSGSIIGCNTRRYHGLLVGSLHPPANRIVALSNCLECVSIDGAGAELADFEFDKAIHPKGFRFINEFRRDLGVHFDYALDAVELTKSIYLLPDADTIAIVYNFSRVFKEFDFSVRPLVALRDFHSLQKSDAELYSQWHDEGLVVRGPTEDTGELLLRSEHMWFQEDPQWWHNFLYRTEKQRGQDHFEDLFSPGVFNCHIDSPSRIVLWAEFGACGTTRETVEVDLDIVLDGLALREKELTANAGGNNDHAVALYSAAGQFVVERQIEERLESTILAGFPWFLDWGRDTFISLPGLLLCTGRFDEAASVLTTFAGAVDEGMIPNRFDDYAGRPHYNSIDASLWFVHAAFEYKRITGDNQTFSLKLLPAVRWIVDCYRRGTRFGIHADTDGLITGGDEQTQLTWMDAMYEGKAFTPRYGKTIEINALWHRALNGLAEYYADKNPDSAEYYNTLAEQVCENFRKLFWNDKAGYLNDCILPDGTIDSSLRPNQIYAVSLPFSPLTIEQQEKVVETVRQNLLTPYGLRTLDPADKRYVGCYQGPQANRDAAYHQGTVWPYLLGSFIEAYLRVNDFSRQSKTEAAEFLDPLLNHLTEEACLGSISEIFDGDMPHQPKGCFAQAWSVAEILRAYKLISSS